MGQENPFFMAVRDFSASACLSHSRIKLLSQTVHHCYMLCVILYTNISSSVLVNQFISEPLNILRGVRQGCALSPLLYVLCIEPFANQVRLDPNIRVVLMYLALLKHINHFIINWFSSI